MPNINEIITNREKKFKKRNYRSWDLTGNEVDLFANKTKLEPHNNLVKKIAHQENILEKSSLKTEAKVEPNWSQTEAKVEPNWSQTEAKVEPNRTQDEMKVEPQLEPQLEPNWSQTEAKVEPNWSQRNINLLQENEISFLELSGLQKEVIQFIYKICRNNRSAITPPISIKNIANIAKTTVPAVKKAIQRLESKTLLKRMQFRNGRGGWSTYTLTKSIYQEILQLEDQQKVFNNWSQTGAKVEPNWSQTGAKLEPQLEPQLEPNLSSSSSNIFNRSTTTESIMDDLNLDTEPLESIGFKKEHLAQITKQGLIEPSLIQQSIYAFAHDLNSGSISIKKSPLAYFMGVLKRGDPYAPTSSDYVSPGEKARKFYIEKFHQQKEEESIIEKELFKKSYSSWLKNLSKDEKKNMVIETLPDNLKSQWYRYEHNTLEEYYRMNIWPDRRKNVYIESKLPIPELLD